MPKLFTFQSSSQPGVEYTTVLNDGGFITCNCPGYTRRSVRECKHTKQVALSEGITPAREPAQVGLFEEPAADSIPVQPMLASALKEGQSLADFNAREWVMEEKYDGHRLIVRKSERTLGAWSRQGNIRQLPPHLLRAVLCLPSGVYDGELIIPGGTSTDVTAKDKQAQARLVLFDMLAVGDELHPATDRSGLERRSLLLTAVHPGVPEVITVSRQMEPTMVNLRAIWEAGGEGAIVKRNTATYTPGRRSLHWVKFKKLEAAEVRVVGFEAGRLGPHAVILCEDAAGVPVKVKSLNDDWRATFSLNASSFLGRRLVIAYQEKTRDGRYRHPMADHFLE